MKRSTFLAGMASLAVAGLQRPSFAQDTWPARPIKLVVPSAAGAGADLIGRALVERMGAALKQTFVIDNKPGASGLIATRTVLNAQADGYTFLYTHASATVMLAALKPDLGVDFTKDLVPVAQSIVGGVPLLVNPALPVRNLKELVAYVKASPGKYSYGSWGVGSNGHLTMEWLKKLTGMEIEHVPYKSVPGLLTDLISGNIPFGWTDAISPMPHIQAGKLRAIAVNGPVRTPSLPDVATMGEQGFPFEPVGWQGFFAPVGTPPAIVQRMHDELLRVVAMPDMQALLHRMNCDPAVPMSGEQFRAIIARDVEIWRKIVRDGNIQAVD
jgi:tripartite-type tricarboxylate transporter receptor subunit TctC